MGAQWFKDVFGGNNVWVFLVCLGFFVVFFFWLVGFVFLRGRSILCRAASAGELQ